MIERYCDKCGKKLQRIAERYVTASSLKINNTYDLCEECFDSILIFIEGEKAEAETEVEMEIETQNIEEETDSKESNEETCNPK